MKSTNLSGKGASLCASIAILSAALLCGQSLIANQSILLTADNFAVLGGTGISSTGVVGTTISNGNIGLAPADTAFITGFPPAVVTGGSILGTGNATSQARLDLITASVGLAGMATDVNLSNVDMGGMTLTPGVYTFDSDASLNGALFLDAEGQDNVFWVFQIADAFTTSINSSVTVINPGPNGGKDFGIFWNAGSAIIIGGNNQIQGNYLAGTSITIGSGSSGSARALALAQVSLDMNVINTYGAPGGGSWNGGLKYSASGAVVPSDMVSSFYDSNQTADLGDNWKWNNLFGYFYAGYHPFAYVYEGELEWIYIAGDSESEGYLYFDFITGHWCYTHPSTYEQRWYYDLTLEEWKQLT